MPKSAIAGPNGSCIFHFLRSCQNVCLNCGPTSQSHQWCITGAGSLQTLQLWVGFRFNFIGMWWYLRVDLARFLLMANHVAQPSHAYLLSVCLPQLICWPYFQFRSMAFFISILRAPCCRHLFHIEFAIVVHTCFLLSCALSFCLLNRIFCRTRNLSLLSYLGKCSTAELYPKSTDFHFE